MDNSENKKVKDLHQSLSKNVNSKKFGYRKTYIYSHIILKVIFELFVDKEKIGIKPHSDNLKEVEIEFLTKLIHKVDTGFKHRTYGGTKHIYSIWELNISDYSDIEIGEILKRIDEKRILS